MHIHANMAMLQVGNLEGAAAAAKAASQKQAADVRKGLERKGLEDADAVVFDLFGGEEPGGEGRPKNEQSPGQEDHSVSAAETGAATEMAEEDRRSDGTSFWA